MQSMKQVSLCNCCKERSANEKYNNGEIKEDKGLKVRWNKKSNGRDSFVQDGNKLISNNASRKGTIASSIFKTEVVGNATYTLKYKVSSE